MSDWLKNKGLNALLLVSGLALFVLGTVLHPGYQLEAIGVGFEHLGVGLFAVMVLKFTIEKASQAKLFRELSTEVKNQLTMQVRSLITKSTLLQKHPELQEELEKSVISPDFIRPLYDLDLKLEGVAGNEEFLRARVTITYVVQNISDEERKYPVEAWLEDIIKLENPAPEDKPGFRRVVTGTTSHSLGDLIERGTRGDAEKTGAIYKEGLMIHLKDLYTPGIKSMQTLKVTVEGMQLMRRADHFVWNLPTITEKLSISIKLLGLSFDQLEVCPREMHHIGHEEFMKTLDKSEPNVWKLKIDHVVLPFQGVEFRWAPKPKPPLASSIPPTHSTLAPGQPEDKKSIQSTR